MRLRDALERVARAAAARPLVVLLAVAALALGGAALALSLQPDTGTGTLASRSSAPSKATDALHRRFGGDAVVVLIRERVTHLVLTDDLGRAIRLEGCLGGNVPKGAQPYGGAHSPCAALAQLKPAHVVYGPGTFLNESVNAVQQAIQAELQAAGTSVDQAAAAAAQQAKQQGLDASAQRQAAAAARAAASRQAQSDLQQLALSSGIQGIPQLDSKPFIDQVVFDPTRGADVPKARFAYLFPNRDAALIQVRLRPDLTSAQRTRAIGLVREAVRMPLFASKHGGSYVVSGVPVVASDLASAVSDGIAVLLLGAVLAMALALPLVFRARLRLLPLFVALAAAGLTFGLMALVGASLTMASIAVLPVLIGLAVDYAIQFQSRVEEQRARGADGADAVRAAAWVGAPAIATAALATASGFLVLLLSPVPMVRSFGLLLIAGIALAFLCALTAGSAALALVHGARDAPAAARRHAGAPDGLPSARLLAMTQRAGGALAGAALGARELLVAAGRALARLAPGGAARATRSAVARLVPQGLARRAAHLPRAVFAASLARPGRVLAVGFVLAAIGWVADTQTRVVSDVQRLVPANLPALRDLSTLQDETDSSGEIDVLVRARDIASPRVVHWMSDYQQRVLKRFGYAEAKGCRAATLCPAFSLPDLFQGTSTGSARSIDALLASVPPYFASGVLTRDRSAATLAFGIRLMPLARQQRVVEAMRDELRPPPGVTAQLGGLPVIAAQANADLSAPGRRLLTLLAGLLAVGLVLLALFRRLERALVPLVPIALASGWSALVLYATRVPLNPMSATLGALVIAIATEFSVLLSERFRQERAAGHELAAALARTYRSTGRAVLASGVTAIAGFGVLALSDIRMLRDFGIVTVVDLTVALAGVLVVLPAVLVLAERGVAGRIAQRVRRAGRVPGRSARQPPAPVQ
jgi:hydrophobe/amphiphile efflux-3 (HAE3) family protein